MGVLEVLAGARILVLLAIWRATAESARQQKRAADWLQHIANKGSPGGAALPD